ncbi:conserved exported hypothetical protein [Hyella patelloides LEGE 07179]|uniref:Uncharacterized protein n=1 Tax=Hyella patelloides LEGE 07179 TaxID=945734 RepID=A0A563VL96_9CYAN|nr:hypothetical protein [Hyella patelloides]VEP12224.1 conserved exported hypothetical protein [Hyella patelloides LEGE 07179]
MYRKLLLSGLTALSVITLSSNNLVSAFSANNDPTKRECTAIDSSKLNQKSDILQKFNFSEHLNVKIEGSGIVAQFVPQNTQQQAIELDDLAAATGYKSFNWVNYVEQDPYGIADYQGNLLSLPYNDPPPGGYQYEAADRQPFYWDIEKCENCSSRHYYQHPKIKQKFTLTFEDHPSDYRLQLGETIEFVTHLVGVKNSHLNQERLQWDVLSTFKWQLSNNAAGRSQVSLIAVEHNVLELSSSLLAQIQNDGGIIPDLEIATQDKYNSHSPQCPLQSHQNQHLDSHL